MTADGRIYGQDFEGPELNFFMTVVSYPIQVLMWGAFILFFVWLLIWDALSYKVKMVFDRVKKVKLVDAS